ncbi:bifunctional RAD3-XPD family/Helical and beta-bridge domain/ATP-dependent helicase [Babesia duncani]|uniref:DNA 5'-3' helicase n=1 Tax=Babesia duncani TaxID=323732 RepID=A0AAD9UPN0_9APIC|nr:bifunctional RAD3-XPD family/Helical and beta-bridge domain/ATP-dependent helicase [Babesia duncani]
MVNFWVDGVKVYFPYPKIYPEQLAYLRSLKTALDARGHAVLEMPTGTGKTVAIFSFVTSYQYYNTWLEKFIYCTRTIPEMEKSLHELSRVYTYRKSEMEKSVNPEIKQQEIKNEPDVKKTNGNSKFLAIGLCSRRNLCIHPEASSCADRTKIDERCHEMTSPWKRMDYENDAEVRMKEHTLQFGNSSTVSINEPKCSLTEHVPDIEDFNAKGLCGYYENLERRWSPLYMPEGVYTLEGLKEYCNNYRDPITGEASPICPYFAARRAISVANVVVLNYQYMIDPKVADAAIPHIPPERQKSKGANKDNNGTPEKLPMVVVFDEAHNIDNVCIEVLSVEFNDDNLNEAYAQLEKLQAQVKEHRERNEEALLTEYRNLYENCPIQALDVEGYKCPVLPAHILDAAVPGNIRKAEHFISFMKTIIGYLKQYIKVYEPKSEGPLMFLHRFEIETGIIASTLQHTFNRMKSLLYTLQLTTIGELSPLQLVVDFCTLVATYTSGFIVIVEPFPQGTLYDPMLQLSCLDASLAIKSVFQSFQSVILTSGTISPLDFYPKILDFEPHVTQSLPMSLDRDCICPIIVSKGANQVQMSTRFDMRSDVTVLRNYGTLLIELCRHIPDGVVCFFPSYAYMELIISHWYEHGIIASIMEHKLVFMETKDVVTTTLALHNYRKACDVGRGALFLSICRGKIAEGIDFDRHYGRCVILIGVPFQYTLSRQLKARLGYMKENYGIMENEFMTFDAMRQAAQCVGRIIRNKTDCGLMVFADSRYSRIDKRSKLPPWIIKNMEPGNLSLTTESAIMVAKTFFRAMAQEYVPNRFTRFDQEMLADPHAWWASVQAILKI